MKRVSVIVLTVLILAFYCTTALAGTDRVACINVNRDAVISNDIDKLRDDIYQLYDKTATSVNVPYKYVKIMHIIAGGRAIYTDKNPDIYTDITSTALRAPFDIEGAPNEYNRKAPVECGDKNLERPSKYFLPDASYNVISEIVDIMQVRYEYNTKNRGNIFSELVSDVKSDIVFYESMLKYCGGTEEEVDSILDTYINLIRLKDKNEYVVYINEAGQYKIIEKYENLFSGYSEESRNRLAIALSLDSYLAITNDLYDITDGEKEVFKVGDTSRKNLLMTAMSVAGDVRYIWGGGHMGTNNIDGVSPIWIMFNDCYDNNCCIAPRKSWCPVHGHMENSDNSCIFKDTKVGSINDYLRLRRNIINKSNKIVTYNGLAEVYGGDFKESVEPHRLEGLDCSGYIGWVYNQIDKSRVYSGVALDFVKVNSMAEIGMNTKLLPGDVVAWDTHIIAIVGRVSNSGKAYITIEQAPNTVRLGVLVYNGVSSKEVDRAMRIAYEGNCELKDNLKNEAVKVYNINNLEYRYNEEDCTNTKVLSIGRLKERFDDEDKIVDGYDKTIKELYADEIISYITTNIKDRRKE